VKFSEPINFGEDAKDAFDINNGEYFVKSVTPLNNNTEANIELYSKLDEGTVTLSIDNSLEDYAGFNLVATKVELDVVEDEEAPYVVDYKDATPNGVTLIFNEDIQLADDVTKADFYHTNSKNTVDQDIDPDTAGDQIGAEVEGNELKLTFKDNPLPEGTAYVYIDGEALVDLWGNVNENQIRVPIEVTVDKTKPEVKDIKVVSEDKIEVAFTEELASDSLDEENFTLLKDGEEKDLVKKVFFKDADNDVVVVEFSEKLTGEYALVIEDLEDIAGNEIEKSTVTFDVDDLTAPVIADFEATLYDADEELQKLVINFKEAMSVDGKYSVVDLEKYVIDNTSLADLDDVKIKAVENNTKVEITIPEDELDLTTGQDYQLQIARVADAAGNYTEKLSDKITVQDQGFVEFKSAEAVDTETIKVTFDDMFASFDYNDLKVVTNDTNEDEQDISGVTIDVDKDGNTVATIKLANELDFNATTDGTTGIKVKVVNTESENKYGESLQVNDEIVVDDKIAPELIKTDNEFVLTDNNDNSITLTFTESVTAINDNLAATDLVVKADGETLVAGTDFTFDIDNTATGATTATLTLINDYEGFDGELTVETVDNVKYIKDVEGNTLAAIDMAEVVVDTPAEIKDVVISSDNSKITVTFTEGVYSAIGKTGALDASDFDVTISKPDTDETITVDSVEHTAGSDTIVFNVTLGGTIDGDETITIDVKADSVYDSTDRVTPDSETATVTTN
jgi:hypothetical protein